MLILGATSAIALTEVEKPASGIKRLKTPYLSTVGDKRESDLLHLHWISNIDIPSVAQIFIRKYLCQMFKKCVLLKDFNCCWKQKNKRLQNIKYIKVKVKTKMF